MGGRGGKKAEGLAEGDSGELEARSYFETSSASLGLTMM